MFQRFTDRARRVVVVAREQARTLHHDHIGTEHLLLGLTYGGGIAVRTLESLGVSLATVRQQVADFIGHGESAAIGCLPFTVGAKKAFELALREALRLGDDYIGTEHILLGLVREGEGITPQILGAYGIDVIMVRDQIMRLQVVCE